MILTKEQIEKRLSSKDNVATLIEKDKQVVYKDGLNHFGKNGGHDLTPEEKEVIGTLANLEGNEVTAEIMGVSPHTARHLRTAQATLHTNGRESTRHGYDENLRTKIAERLEDVRLTISERAADRLLKSFGCLTDDKLENCSAKDVSQIANQMSQVMRNMSSRNDGKNGPSVRVVINKPQEASESSFDIIEMKVG